MFSRLGRGLAAPDDELVEAAAGGERLVAVIRFWFFTIVVCVPVAVVGLSGGQVTADVWVGMAAAAIAISVASIILWVVSRGIRIPGLAFWTSAFDVSIVTAALVACALVGRPIVAVNSMVLWEIYLLAILATCLRFDLRVCLFAGVLSMIQYGAVLWWVTTTYDLISEARADAQYGNVAWILQASRMVLQAAATGLAVGIVLRTRRLLELSGTDALTGLANRFFFEEHLAKEIARSERTGRKLAVVFLDLDHFKHFNDSYGHDVGDQALQTVARVLLAESRRDDLVARWGGEEFVLVCSGCDLRAAVDKAERIRQRLAQTAMPSAANGMHLTLSAGVAEWPSDGEDPAHLVNVADQRLLAAKQAGRDQVISTNHSRSEA